MKVNRIEKYEATGVAINMQNTIYRSYFGVFVLYRSYIINQMRK